MYKIIDERGVGGKSSRLMLLAKENNGIIVCGYPTRMREKAYEYGLTGITFISYAEYIYMDESVVKGRPVYIDDVDMMLKAYDPHIEGITLSK